MRISKKILFVCREISVKGNVSELMINSTKEILVYVQGECGRVMSCR